MVLDAYNPQHDLNSKRENTTMQSDSIEHIAVKPPKIPNAIWALNNELTNNFYKDESDDGLNKQNINSSFDSVSNLSSSYCDSNDIVNFPESIISDRQLKKTKSANDDILTGFSSVWFNGTLEELLDFKLVSLGPVWSVNAIQDCILELTSQHRRIESVILSKLILKKDALIEKSQYIFQLSHSLHSAIKAIQSQRQELVNLRKKLVLHGMISSRLLLTRRRALITTRVLSILGELFELDTLAQRQLLSGNYSEAAIHLYCIEKLLSQSTLTIESIPLQSLGQLKLKSLSSWDNVHQKLVYQINNILLSCLSSSESPSFFNLDKLLQTMSIFKTKNSAGIDMITFLSGMIPNESRRCLFYSADLEWKNTLHDISAIGVVDICTHISGEKIVESIVCLLDCYWTLYLVYSRIILYIEQLRLQISSSKDSFLKFDDTTMISGFSLNYLKETVLLKDDVLQYYQQVLHDLTIGKETLWHRQQQYLLLALQSLTTTFPCITTVEFLKIILLVQRFCVEVHCFLLSQSHYWEKRNEPVSFLSFWELSTCHNVLDYLKHLSRLHLQSCLTDGLIRLRSFLYEDSWQRLPIIHMSFKDLIHIPSKKKINFFFWEIPLLSNEADIETLSPAYMTQNNPFFDWKNQCNWLTHYTNNPPTFQDESYIDQITGTNSFGTPDDLSNLERSNKSPVISASCRQLCRTVDTFLQLSYIIPDLTLDICIASTILLDVFVFAIVHFFSSVSSRDLLLSNFLISSNCHGGASFYLKHKQYLFQRPFSLLKKIVFYLVSITHPTLSHHRNVMLHNSASLPLYPFINIHQLDTHPHHEKINHTIHDQLQIISFTMNDMVLTPFFKLDSPGCLWGLAERVTAVESCYSILNVLKYSFRLTSPLIENESHSNYSFFHNDYDHYYCEALFQERTEMIQQLRYFIYSQAAKDIFDLDPFVNTICLWDWEQRHQDLGLAIEQLRVQLQDLARRIACCGGGSIPHNIQQQLWIYIGEHSVETCIEALAQNSKSFPKSNGIDIVVPPPSLFSLAENFRQFLTIVALEIEKVDKGGESSSFSHIINPNPIVSQQATITYGIDLTRLTNYIHGHSYQGGDLMSWCKLQTDFNIYLLIQIINKIETHHIKRKASIAELEIWFIDYLRSIQHPSSKEYPTHND